MKKLLSLLMAIVMLMSTMSGIGMVANAEDVAVSTYTAQVQGTSTLTVVPEVKLTQTKINYLDQTITISNADALINEGVTAIGVTAEMIYNNVVTKSRAAQITLEKGKTDYSFAYPTYGKFKTTITFNKGTVTACTTVATVGIIAEEYNIAPLNASFPVIYFTLAIQDCSVNEKGEPVPGFVFLERDDAYDWNALTENLYALPYATQEQLHNGRAYFHQLKTIMGDFVKDLYEVSPKSKFNLYTVDNYCENILINLTANNIPESQYHVYLLSDGSGSYNIFNNTFNAANSSATYDEMTQEWKRVKAQVSTEHKFSGDMVKKYLDVGGTAFQVLQKYAYVIAKEEANVEWWLARVNDTLKSPDATFLASVKAQSTEPDGCIKVKAMNTMLTALQSKGDKAVAAFKNMYKFNNAMFSEAQTKNKKVMILLGTRVDLETNFEDFAKFVKRYYGDDYIYYYKGHPATPTGLYPQKQEQLDKLGVTDVESSVAAEIILFFYPGVYLCGYQSSTFLSVTDDEKACALFNVNKTCAESYAKSMDSFISKIDTANEYYKPYAQYCTDSTKTYYLVEYNKTDKYSYSIYNATDDKLVNFKDTGVNAVYNYSIVNKGNVIEKGENNLVTLPKLDSNDVFTFKGWSDGTKLYPAEITVMIKDNTVFTAVWSEKISEANVTLSTTSYTYNAKVKSPAVTVKDSEGKVIDKSNYTVTYASGRKDIGKYSVKVKLTGNYSGTITKYFTIKPAGTTVSSVKAASKKFTVKWKKQATKTTGYQIQYSTDKNFKTGNKTITVKSTKTTAKTVSKLKGSKKYYVRVRTYKTVSKTNYYSKWSAAKAVTTKK